VQRRAHRPPHPHTHLETSSVLPSPGMCSPWVCTLVAVVPSGAEFRKVRWYREPGRMRMSGPGDRHAAVLDVRYPNRVADNTQNSMLRAP
jgi:hypothetical protein